MKLQALGLGYKILDRKTGHLQIAIEDLNVQLGGGEIVAILGSSGCGKSTLLRLLGGFVEPQEGRVTCDGEEFRQPFAPVCLVFQDYTAAVFPWMTVRQNIEMAREPTLRRPEDLSDVASRLGIGEKLDSYPTRLSGGERQRVQLARALFGSPKMLLLDEPSSSLDVVLRATLLELLAGEVKQRDMGMLLVTHNIDEAVFIADRIYTTRKGKDDGKLQLHERAGYRRSAANLGMAQKDEAFQFIYKAVYDDLFEPGAVQ